MVPTGLGAFLSNVLFSLELTPPSTIIWPLQTIYRERGVNTTSGIDPPQKRCWVKLKLLGKQYIA